MFSGSIPALVTPFRDGAIDESAFRALVDWQIAEGSSALVPCGTTGESSTMTVAEHNRVVAVCVDQAAGRAPVIAGCGSNDTRIALEHMFAAQAAGADAALVVVPYYNKPSQEGVYRHYAYLAERCDLPIVIYNVPGRTITDIGVPVIHRLTQDFQTIVGIKDATGNLGRVTAQRLACGPDFCQLSGNDETALSFNASGGRGCISVTANVAPRLCAEFQAACARGDWTGALALHDRLYPLHDALFSDSSPGPVKYALTRVRPDMPGDVRLPVTWPSESSRAAVDRALEIAGLV
ncbi:4-hydroxy-tetrahydrodipicolinate synthase [Sphingobium wenxiniae]|jgi:4-hydroxy-tetrahydrodipicolinate synthase|uniref:4-hydroxy-tetrahydrodipicolinate synthase n=2 Tax=Sphingobium TaxID=165695 RepID=T0GRC3_9SPHN|nr:MULTISPECIES: 4-hydroxy-tetrahydrodipicolinate synthase [Sphingobium]EQB02533.1 dihydrodipicolinate synthase [Sphingobium baderi LL03]KMS60745.1 dihydrodipicolinate synthase [Sphingobium baderi LL03]MBB6191371.1 4-hydroxy-tetrahydrodipicolinate synthase [Sphingobium wenxiniae]TWH93334.1 4-hydroxy-tetrahydrodipicolinate synthase [Sphingobium wenxiniae]WRD76129.1 4-hydroxy-tetrahydrodipicolinate synthase [Sphingobium baderi]